MLDSARKRKAGRLQDLCDIETIHIGGIEQYKTVRESYGRKWQVEAEVKEAAKMLEGQEAMNALRGMFAG